MSGDIDLVPMGFSCLLLALATLSAHASSALLVFSPTKLQRALGPERGAAALVLLRAHAIEFRVLARLMMVASATISLLLAERSLQGTLGQIAFVGICLAMVLLVAVMPAAVAQRGAERVVATLLPALRPLRLILLYPVIRPLIRVSRPLLRAMGIPENPPTDPDEIADEILAAVADTADGGSLAEEERAWIGNIVELKERHASEVMTPRTDIDALAAETPLTAAIGTAVEKGHSRLPVYRDSIDNVVGIFYVKDVLGRLAREEDTHSTTVGEVMREALFAPESMRVSDLLREFKTSKVQMAIVLDEYGGTAGLITIEDILEEIVGEIMDEFDPEEEEPILVIRDRQVIEVSGRTRVEEANAAIAEERIPEGEDYDTLGGLVFSHLGHIPETGTTFARDGVEYKVIRVENRRIERLRLTLLEPQPADRA